MSPHDERIRVIDDSEFAMGQIFLPERTDPRNALTEASRDHMIARRREAGLASYPEHPLYPELEVNFEPSVRELIPS